MKEGVITKGIGGFYYVMTEDGMVESHARGVFRDNKLTPVIGDRVRLRVDREDGKGYIEELLPRTSQLVRPAVANVTQTIVVMSIKEPKINTWLLDRFVMMSEHENLKTVICINKSDLNLEEAKEVIEAYELAGYDVIKSSAKEEFGLDELREKLKGEISVFAGPSGVGKSSLLNLISDRFNLEVGGVSKKTQRGKHTTRHVELLMLDEDSYVLDTPGFSSLNLNFLKDETMVRHYFKEIDKYGEDCKFLSCMHKNEPNCNVKDKLAEGKISKLRYENYLKFLEEVKNIKRY